MGQRVLQGALSWLRTLVSSGEYTDEMIRIEDTLGGERVVFYCAQSKEDCRMLVDRFRRYDVWALDTESTGINPYRVGWELRTFQFGRSNVSYVVPARFRHTIGRIITRRGVKWIGHNGPHDIRSLDVHLGYETGVQCAGETYILAHHQDSRKHEDGGIGHGLKELALHHIAPDGGKWETALKKAFKELTIEIPGQVYKSGPRKGQQKVRKAKYAEGWSLIDPSHPAYIAYAASDPVLTYRLWYTLRHVAEGSPELYRFDRKVQLACDRLQRRAIRLDTRYTTRLTVEYTRHAQTMQRVAAGYGVQSIHSGAQIAKALQTQGVELIEQTPTGQWAMSDRIMRQIMNEAAPPSAVYHLLHAVLLAKQLLKRRESYTEAALREMDSEGRVHPSINSLAARTARMSVSNPPLQQLPTKDRESDNA